MFETTEQLYAPLDPQIPECAESSSALPDESCLTVEILQCWDILWLPKTPSGLETVLQTPM
jgi:hypothetical protein